MINKLNSVKQNFIRFSGLGGVAQLARASALHAEGHRFDSCHLHNCNDSEMNDGTDAMYEMETWACPDTNRTDITTLYAGVAE